MCGGTAIGLSMVTSMRGLSPRVRGNQCILNDRVKCGGSIPACAGEPSARSGPSLFAPVYPRVCGGTSSTPYNSRWLVGPPRVRGNRLKRMCTAVDHRSIPACAGEPMILKGKSPKCRVYPRVCGGTVRSSLGPFLFEGLSPRVRGNLRIIPLDPFEGAALRHALPGQGR